MDGSLFNRRTYRKLLSKGENVATFESVAVEESSNGRKAKPHGAQNPWLALKSRSNEHRIVRAEVVAPGSIWCLFGVY